MKKKTKPSIRTQLSLCLVSIEISSPLSFKTNEENEKLHFIKQITL